MPNEREISDLSSYDAANWAQIAAAVASSRAAQGLPARIEDMVTLQRAQVLFNR